MTSILEGEWAQEMADALEGAGIPYPLVVTRSEWVEGVPWEPGSGHWEHVPHECRGWVDDYSAFERSGTLIEANDRKIFVVASSLAIEPTPADTVTVDGKVFSIITVTIDPAGAAWIIQGRA